MFMPSPFIFFNKKERNLKISRPYALFKLIENALVANFGVLEARSAPPKHYCRHPPTFITAVRF
ncbi:MAG: hypothetical protein DBY30_03260 [Verrucomicrobia bacterium]|nr:MAG: hypothetical protein DBY30_03260 [Verrucomicrobiota bacterium]